METIGEGARIEWWKIISSVEMLRNMRPKESLSEKQTFQNEYFWERRARNYTYKHQFSSVQFSHSVMSDSLRPRESQHTRPSCPSPTPRVHLNSCPLSWWCHPAISSSVVLFSCPQSLPASESFPVSQLFAWGGQSIGVSALASFLPKNTQDWSPQLSFKN